MRLALAITGGFKGEGDFAVAVEPEMARALAGFAASEALILPIDRDAGDVGIGRLVAVAPDGGGGQVARFRAGRRLGAAALAGLLHGPFPLQLVADADYAALVAVADAEAFVQPEATPKSEATDLSAVFSYAAEADAPPVNAVLETLRRETGNICALTGAPLVPGSLPVAIRWEGAAGLHVNNLLLLSPAAETAFREGHFTVRDDFSIIVDFRRIDPELLERINPNGRLRVPENSALRPAPDNLAWHRRRVFGLG